MGKGEIHIPDTLLHELSGTSHKKLVNREIFSISATNTKILPMLALSELAGWNQTEDDLTAFSDYADINCLAEVTCDNETIPVGSGLVLKTGSFLKWVGMILVHPGLRRQGIATEIMIKCLEHLRSANDKGIIGLDATPDGMPLYNFLGFEKSFKISRCKINSMEGSSDFSGMHISLIRNPTEIESYAFANGFKDRKTFLRILFELSKGSGFVLRKNNVVSGFIMSRPGRSYPYIGPLVADSEEIARQLLNRVLWHWYNKQYNTLYIDIPFLHFRNSRTLFLNNMSLDHSRDFDRMYHVISREKLHRIKENLFQGKPGKADSGRIYRVMEASVKSYEITREYMSREKEKWIRNIYAIGGPEIG